MKVIFFWLILSALIFSVGEYFSKKFAIKPSIRLAVVIVSIYAMGSLAWLPAISRGQVLSTIGTIWNVLSLLATLFVGVYVFNETLTGIQVLGILFALIAIFLLSL